MAPPLGFGRRTFLQLLGLGGLGLAAGCRVPAPEMSPGIPNTPKDPVVLDTRDPFVRPVQQEKKVQQEEPAYRPHSFSPSTFAAYQRATSSISPDAPEVVLEDRLLDEYLRLPIKTDELEEQMAHCPDEEPHFRKDAMIPVRDPAHLQELVLAAAQELGYSAQQVAELPIADAVLLSGRIVASKLDYAEEMILKENGRKIPLEEALARAYRGERFHNEKADAIDSLPADDLLEGGRGVCRNYAAVNVAVFNVLKGLNPRLKNTNMRTYSSQQYDHVIQLPHAWNLVSTLVDEGNAFVVRATYVDPTWLDTRVRNAANDSTEGSSKQLSDEEAYNAFDGAHFGFVRELDSDDVERDLPGVDGEPHDGHDLQSLLYEMMSTARMYEVLANDKRTENRDSQFYIPTSLLAYYRNRAFDFRIASAYAMLDSVNTLAPIVESTEREEEYKEQEDSLRAFLYLEFDGKYRDLQLSIARAVENMTGVSSGTLLYSSSYDYDDQKIMVSQDQLEKVQHMAGLVRKYLPQAASQKFDFDDDGDMNIFPEKICGKHAVGNPYATTSSLSELFAAIEKKVVAATSPSRSLSPDQ
ncbi:hypothetical protein HYU19_05820 [Candidatus Woesearchaeota archaeon]|nr:hypothetical protein [Candidatus Woesearchaeota archaeon]